MSHSSRKGWVRFNVEAATCFRSTALCLSTVVGLVAPITQGAAQPTSPVQTVAFVPRTGYEGPLVLRLPTSARLLGMANVGVSTNDADALFYSPGMLGQARGVSVSAQTYGSNATAGSFASVQTFGAYAIAVGAQRLEFAGRYNFWEDDAKQGAPRLSDGGDQPSVSSAFTFGVGRTLKGYRLGASAKYVEERFDLAKSGGWALDVGMNKPLGPATLAIAVQNIGPSLDLGYVSGPLPTRVTVGYGGGLFPIWEKFDIGMQTAVSVERDGFVRPAGGVEVGYVPVEGVAVILRSGLRLPREKDEPLATGGVGLTVDRFSFDYALEPMRGGRPVSHRVGIRIK